MKPAIAISPATTNQSGLRMSGLRWQLQEAGAVAAAHERERWRAAVRRLREVVGVSRGDRQPEPAALGEAPSGRQQREAQKLRLARRHRLRRRAAEAAP